MKKLLILGAGIYQVPLIKKAKEMGLYTIAASCAGNYPGLALVDEVWEVDTTDHAALTALAGKAAIDGVCTSGTDVAVLSLGSICQALGLPGVPLDCARKVTDKALMKDALQTHGVATPEACKVSSLEEARAAFAQFGPPVIVKAVDSSGSRGVTRADTPEELEAAWQAARAVTRKEYLLVERFIQADEIGVDGFIFQGKPCFLLPHEKFTCRVGGVTLPEGHRFPFRCSLALADEIRLQMEQAVTALGLDHCAVNADILVKGNQAWILEIGARAGATCIPELISAYCGFDYYEQMIRCALGETPEFSMGEPHPCMAKLLFSGRDGRLTSIDQEALRRLGRECLDLSLDYPVGARVERVQNGTSRIGQVILETDSPEELEHMMRRVRRTVTVDGTDLETLWNE